MSIVTHLIEAQEVWDEFLKNHEEVNFLQSWQWGEFHKALGKQAEHVGFYKDDQLIGVMLCVVENAKRGRYMTVSGGPIIDWKDKELVIRAFEEMRQVGRRNKCVFVRVRPQLVADQQSLQLFKDAGLTPSPMHLSADLTTQLDLNPSAEILLANMRKNTRYDIKRAQKEGITVVTSTDVNDIQEFYNLQLATAKRQGFVPFSYEFLREQFKIFEESGNALLYKAHKDGQLLAEAFVIFYGVEASYHYGASTDVGRKYPGAYLIQWEAIQEAKRRGMRRYNFWGVVALTETNHRFYGVSVFKRGFGGQDVHYVEAYDLVLDKPRYIVNVLIETARRKLRRLD